MRYHLKEDGTAGVCKATPGNCPKGDAIHGESVQEVYSQLEAVMNDQLFSTDTYAKPEPRPTARELGSDGMMMQYSKPVIVKEQLQALKKLGLLDKAMPTLEKHSPILAAAWGAKQEDAVDYDLLYVEPQRYSYEGADGGAYTAMTKTWVAPTVYELQTVALHSLVDTLETGKLEDVDLDAYRTALGETSESHDGFLAFNFNPARQKDDFFNNIKNRLEKEGLRKKEIGGGASRFTVPSFVWDGLDQDSKEQTVVTMLSSDYNPRIYGTKNFQDRVLNRNNFGKVLSSIFAPHRELNEKPVKEGEIKRFGLDHDGSYAEGKFSLTDDGFEWRETARVYAEPKPTPSW